MKIQNVSDTSFKKYGKNLKGYPTDKILKEMQHTPLPDDVIYVPSVDTLEATSDAKIFQGKGFGGLDIEIGYCNGNNHKLNGLEYHRSSEINIAVNDLVLILGVQQISQRNSNMIHRKQKRFWSQKEQQSKFMQQHFITHHVMQKVKRFPLCHHSSKRDKRRLNIYTRQRRRRQTFNCPE